MADHKVTKCTTTVLNMKNILCSVFLNKKNANEYLATIRPSICSEIRPFDQTTNRPFDHINLLTFQPYNCTFIQSTSGVARVLALGEGFDGVAAVHSQRPCRGWVQTRESSRSSWDDFGLWSQVDFSLSHRQIETAKSLLTQVDLIRFGRKIVGKWK